MGTNQLYLHQELMLLVLDDSKGSFVGSMYQYGLAGAILSELLLLGRIKVSGDDEKLVSIALSNPTGNELLDDVLQKISTSKKPYSLKHWVSSVASTKELCQRIAKELCDQGILSYEEKKILWVFTSRKYPELDCSFEDEIRSRLAKVMFSSEVKPDERTAVLVAFANCSNALNANFAKVELKQHEKRIQAIAEGNLLASEATSEAIEAVRTALMAASIASTAAITAATVASN